jgi:hypothetical protein
MGLTNHKPKSPIHGATLSSMAIYRRAMMSSIDAIR